MPTDLATVSADDAGPRTAPHARPRADPPAPAARRARAVTDRIDRIRAELAGGRYGVDLDRLAEHILEDDVERTPDP